MQAPEFIRNNVARLEGSASAGRLAERVRPFAKKVGESRAGPVLRGEWLGHAAHPMLTDLPIGCWTSAMVLDLVGGRSSRKAAQRLVGLGVLFVPPAALSGWADYDTIGDRAEDQATRRLGAVHGVGNVAIAGVYLMSWLSRRRGQHVRGVVLGLVGGTLTVVTAYLGGHMAFGQGPSSESEGLVDPVTDGPGRDGLVDLRQASDLLTVPPEQVRAMVREGMLTPSVVGETLLFERAEVMAVRLQGG